MLPEESRLAHYNKLNFNYYHEILSVDDKIVVYYDDKSDIDYKLISAITNTINGLIQTLEVGAKYTDFIHRTNIYFIDKHTVFILLDLSDYNIPLFLGRGKNNLFALKRLISNLAGQWSRINNCKFAITMDIKQIL